MKKCTKCRTEKPLLEFAKDSGKKDGFCSWCKACKKKINDRYRKRNKKIIALKAKKYYCKNKKRYRVWAKAWGKTPNGMKSKRESLKRSYHKNIKAGRARTMLRYKVFQGEIKKPINCEKCNKTDCRINGHHHKGYEKEHWYDVQWICDDCHWKVHNES